jgi:hypothetical protein
MISLMPMPYDESTKSSARLGHAAHVIVVVSFLHVFYFCRFRLLRAIQAHVYPINTLILHDHHPNKSSQTRQTTLLNFSQSPAATQERDEAHDTSRGKGLEEVPAGVVHEENALHRQYGAIKERMRYRRIAQSFAQVASIRTQRGPYSEQYR